MAHIHGQQHGLGQYFRQGRPTASKRPVYLFQHQRKYRGSGSLLGPAPHFLMVEHHHQINASVPAARGDSVHQGGDGSQIVQSGRRIEFSLRSTEGSLLRIIYIQLIIQNVLFFHAQLFRQKSRKHVFLLVLVQGKQGQHMHLPVQLNPFIQVPLHVDGNIRYHQKRLPKIHQSKLWTEHIRRAERHPARQGKRPVQPAHQVDPAVGFHIQPHVVAGTHFRTGFHAEARKVPMGRGHPQAVPGFPFFAYRKGKDQRVIHGYQVFSAPFQLPPAGKRQFLKFFLM